MRTSYEQYSLVWLDEYTIAAFTIIGALVTIMSGISSMFDKSRSRLATVCNSINSTSEQVYNAPYLLLNATRNSIITAKNNIFQTLITILAVLEGCLAWLISLYYSLYRCIFGVAIDFVFAIVEKIVGPLNTVVNGLASVFTGSSNSTGNWTTSIESFQTKIDSTFGDNGNALVAKVIDAPFEVLDDALNKTFNGWSPVNLTLLDRNNTNITTCNPVKLINFIDDAEKAILDIVKYAIIAIGLVCFFYIVYNIIIIWTKSWLSRKIRGLASKVFPPSNISSSDDETIRREQDRTGIRMIEFMTHPTSMYCFIGGFGGLLIISCLDHFIHSKTQELFQGFNQTALNWTNDIANDLTFNATKQFTEINNWINATEFELNNHTFGTVKNVATTINSSISTVIDSVQNSVESVFNNTLFEKPILGLVQCLFLDKLEAVEKGLTWVVKHASINLTRLTISDMDMFDIGPALQSLVLAHLQIDSDGWSIASALKGVYQFFYMLIILWGITLCICIIWQVKYKFFRKQKANINPNNNVEEEYNEKPRETSPHLNRAFLGKVKDFGSRHT